MNEELENDDDFYKKKYKPDYYVLKGEFKRDFKKKRNKEGIYNISQYLISKHYVKTLKGSRKEILVYQDGIYISGEEIIRKDIRDLLEEFSTSHTIKEILDTIKDGSSVDRSVFKVNKNLLNLENGTLDIETMELVPHNPENLFLTKLPLFFNPNSECPTITKFLNDVLDDEQLVVIQEWLGYCLYPEYFIKKAVILVGDGDTGKTTLINLINSFVGENNVSGVSLQKISSDKFACSYLYSKYVNIYDDLSFKDIKDNGAFKIATGGGIITGEKKFGDQFQFKNYAKLTFACNKIPDVNESDDDAYFNRWIVVRFNYKIEEKDKDRQLIHKMTTQDELSGLLNFALQGLKRLLENQKFSYQKTVEEIKTEMSHSASSIAMFVGDCIQQSENNWISKNDLYNAYAQYSRDNKLSIASLKKFGSGFPKFATYASEIRPIDPYTGKQATSTAWSHIEIRKTHTHLLPNKKEAEQYNLIQDTS